MFLARVLRQNELNCWASVPIGCGGVGVVLRVGWFRAVQPEAQSWDQQHWRPWELVRHAVPQID